MTSDVGELLEMPNEACFEWRIADFFMKSEVDTLYTSPKFLFSDSVWSLHLYPNGQTCNETEGNIGLYLWRYDCGSMKTVGFTFGIKKANGREEILVRKEDGIPFDKTGWGTDELISRSELLSRKSELAPSDVLTLTCTVNSDCTVKVSLFSGLWNLTRNLMDIFNAKKKTDTVFKLKGGKIPAHRMILEARSTVFDRMFDVDMLETHTGEVNITDVDKRVFKVVLHYVYGGEPDGLSTDNMCQVYKVAHRYDLQDLRQLCVEFMKNSLAPDCICDIFAVSHLYEEKSLKELAKDYFINNKFEIFKSKKWKIYKRDSPEVIFELVECAFGCIN